MRLFEWEKKGILFQPTIDGFTHGSHPCVLHIKNDCFIIAFSCRDLQKRSHIFLVYAKASNGIIELTGEPVLALEPGPLGHFDCDGVLSSSFLSLEGKDYLYYGGWENLISVPYTANTGRLLFDRESLTLTREFPCPVLGRNPQSPIFSGAPAFLRVEDKIWAWYTSASRWEKHENVTKHYYSQRRAISTDGVNWVSDSELAIPFADEYEYAVARSSVILIDEIYYMWFAHRATRDVATYRIGLAFSNDALHWKRVDNLSGIDVSPEGWDSEMICYPHVFRHNSWLYMLYNGNRYGATGFGYATARI